MPTDQHSGGHGILAGFVSYSGDDGGLDGFLAEPNDGRSHPGVVLIQEWWGIEPHIKELAERLASEGYVVLAPDLYHGEVVTEPDEAQKAVMKLNLEAAVQEIRHGIDYLQRRDDVSPKQAGLVGFCLGGLLAWHVAELENGELAAVAPFYAAGYQPSAADISRVTAPALIIWAEQDPSVSPQEREYITQLLQQLGKTYATGIYPAGHAFMNDQHDSYDKSSAEQAWSELLTWFNRHLG
jgi:carboxymethylenebutenolidase